MFEKSYRKLALTPPPFSRHISVKPINLQATFTASLSKMTLEDPVASMGLSKAQAKEGAEGER